MKWVYRQQVYAVFLSTCSIIHYTVMCSSSVEPRSNDWTFRGWYIYKYITLQRLQNWWILKNHREIVSVTGCSSYSFLSPSQISHNLAPSSSDEHIWQHDRENSQAWLTWRLCVSDCTSLQLVSDRLQPRTRTPRPNLCMDVSWQSCCRSEGADCHKCY